MKRTLLALALLVPAFVSAAVKLDVTAKCNETESTKSYSLQESEAAAFAIDGSEVTVDFTLVKEEADSATFHVTVKNHETPCMDEDKVVAYGTEEKIECPKTDSSVTFVVTQE